jgi:predicted O-methyltransferase YrrM
VRYIDFLAQVHGLLKPRTYFEIGVRNGHSMALSSSRSIGVDPAYAIADDVKIAPEVTLYEQTSDDFFAAEKPLSAFDEPAIDLAFIDGLHLYEFVLRDFMNVEKYTAPGSLVIFDDVLPRAVQHAARERETVTWTGDVWKIIPTLREVRPDLILLLVRTSPTGLLLVMGGDLTNGDLAKAYDRLLAEHVDSDEVPPAEFIDRTTAVYPTWVLAAPFWEVLRDQRERGVTAAQGRAELLASLQEWTSTKLTAAQAQAIHPSLTGKPELVPKPVKAAAAASAVPANATTRAVLEQQARRLMVAVGWRRKKVLRLSRAAWAQRRRPKGA